jgi:hypothetical protein
MLQSVIIKLSKKTLSSEFISFQQEVMLQIHRVFPWWSPKLKQNNQDATNHVEDYFKIILLISKKALLLIGIVINPFQLGKLKELSYSESCSVT